MSELEKARKDIELIDREMAKLFEERMRAVGEVAAYKRKKACRSKTLKEKNS